MVERESIRSKPFARQMAREWYGELSARIGVGVGLSQTLIELSDQQLPVSGVAVTTVFIATAHYLNNRRFVNLRHEIYNVNPINSAKEAINRELPQLLDTKAMGYSAGFVAPLVSVDAPLPLKVGLGFASAALASEAFSRTSQIRSNVLDLMDTTDGGPHPLIDRED